MLLERFIKDSVIIELIYNYPEILSISSLSTPKYGDKFLEITVINLTNPILEMKFNGIKLSTDG